MCKQLRVRHTVRSRSSSPNRRDARLFADRIGFLGAKQDKLVAILAAVPLASRSMS